MRYVRMTVEKVKVRELGEVDDLFRRLVEQEVTVSIENFKKPREPDQKKSQKVQEPKRSHELRQERKE